MILLIELLKKPYRTLIDPFKEPFKEPDLPSPMILHDAEVHPLCDKQGWGLQIPDT